MTAGRCGCSPRYRASVWSVRDGKKVRKSFRTLAEARAWRSDGQSALRAGVMRAPSSRRLSDAAEGWLEGARAGAVRNRSGDVYKPSTIRGYEQSLRLRLLPEFGTARIGDIARSDVQDFVDRMMLAGHDAATVRNTLMPLRVIFRRALVRGEVAVNPTIGLELPAVRGTRDRVASPLEARQLLLALSQDREVWATAMYAGLRLGEIQALTWDAVDLERNVIQVVRSWDPVEGPIAPKSRAGHRVVPVPTVLRELLLAYRVGRPHGDELVFGRSGGRTFNPWSINTRAYRVWKKAGLNRITLHECRHTYASFMIAAGVNAKALSTYMGHSSVTITFDRYGHLMPGNEAEAASLLDTYLHGRSGRASA
ncbi:MAG: tyrosine-type recombinase/integrase [Solirubrobacteraceae bacterium]